MTPLRIAVFVVGLLTMACGFGSYPDKDGNYTDQFPATPLSNQVCHEDGDCVATPYKDGSCCPDNCSAQFNVFNKETYERLRTHQKDICSDGAFECDPGTCEPLNYDQKARCTDGYCTIEKISFDSPALNTKAGKRKAGKRKAGKRKAMKQKAGKRKSQ